MGLSKLFKLRRRSEFLKVQHQGRRLVGKVICIDWRKGLQRETRLGITVSSKFGNSPERNRFKRQVREAFRNARTALPSFLDLNITPRTSAKNTSSSIIQSELIQLINNDFESK